MRYIALKDMPFWEKGLALPTSPQGFVRLNEPNRWIYDIELKRLLRDGWIKVYEEKEFTVSDVREAIRLASSKSGRFLNSGLINEIITGLRK